MDTIYTALKQFGSVKMHTPVARYATCGIGGPAKYTVLVTDIPSAVAAFRYIQAENIPHMLIGTGTSTVAPKAGFDGVVLVMQAKACAVKDNTIIAEAGCMAADVAQHSIRANLRGFEWGVALHGTIGATVKQNRAVVSNRIEQYIETVELYYSGEIISVSYSDYQKNYSDCLILRVTIRLSIAQTAEEKITSKQGFLTWLTYKNKTKPEEKNYIKNIFDDILITEETNLKKFDAASETVQEFIKNKYIPASWLIEQVAYRGKGKPGVYVSKTDANSFGVTEHATVTGIEELIEEITEAVYTTYGISLQKGLQIVYS